MKILIRAFKIISTIIISVLLFEFYFRTAEIFIPPYTTDDYILGRSLVPNARITAIKEGFNLTKVNSSGYLGKSYLKYKDDYVVRIALIGDSFVEGIQVKDEHHFRSIIEDELNKSNSNPIYEVLNFGRSGLDFRKMFIHYELIAKKYDPDIILIFVNESDFKTKDRNLGPDVIIEKTNELKIDYSFNKTELFKNKMKFRLFRQFGIYSLFQSINANYQNGLAAKIILDKFYIEDAETEVTKLNFDKNPYKDLNKAVIEKFVSEAKSYHKKFFIIPIKQLSDDTETMLEKYDLKIINLEEVYLQMFNQNHNPFYWPATNVSGHWNQDAHKAIGKYLAKKINNLAEKI